MTISHYMSKALQNASMVRSMFEEGMRLKATHGPSNVFDFSLGNPDLRPPSRLASRLISALQPGPTQVGHGYMPNAGLESTRAAIAEHIGSSYGRNVNTLFKPEHVIMTVGAAGAMNIFLKAVLNPGDNVVVLAPYFMEYNFYIENHGGTIRVVQTDENFRPDPNALFEAMDHRTKAVIINTPNNPTGAVYTTAELKGIADALDRKANAQRRTIYLISDEPYRQIAFGVQVPCIFDYYRDSVIVNSFSKDLSIPGERLGYLCLCPRMRDLSVVAEAATLANRILGFVNAPALFQRVIPELLDEKADLYTYRERSLKMYRALTDMGYTVPESQGTFYLFPKSPIPDDLLFIKRLKEELILAVPGSGFGRGGYLRLSLCVDERTIERSLPGFERTLKKAQSGQLSSLKE